MGKSTVAFNAGSFRVLVIILEIYRQVFFWWDEIFRLGYALSKHQNYSLIPLKGIGGGGMSCAAPLHLYLLIRKKD